MDEPTGLERVEAVAPEMPVATVRVTPDEAREMQQRVNEIIDSVLQPGKDYMKIPGTPKPSLLKPGAEALQRFFGFGSTSSTEHGMLETGAFYAESVVRITNQSGLVLAEATGWCDDEEKGRSGPKWKGNRNTIIQMAQKRAYVSAVKTATATSDHFTQDLEDQQPPQRKPSTADQRLILAELFAQKKPCTLLEAREWVRDQPGAMQRDWVAVQVLGLLTRPDPGGPASTAAGSSAPEGEASAESPSPPLQAGRYVLTRDGAYVTSWDKLGEAVAAVSEMPEGFQLTDSETGQHIETENPGPEKNPETELSTQNGLGPGGELPPDPYEEPEEVEGEVEPF